MTERINHAAEARKHIAVGKDIVNRRAHSLAELGHVAAVLAQSEAMLAIADQLRVQNIIALGEHWEDTGHPSLDAMAPELKVDLKAVLGL